MVAASNDKGVVALVLVMDSMPAFALMATATRPSALARPPMFGWLLPTNNLPLEESKKTPFAIVMLDDVKPLHPVPFQRVIAPPAEPAGPCAKPPTITTCEPIAFMPRTIAPDPPATVKPWKFEIEVPS